MAETFPAILCRLRKERGLNQRTAAADLHISQALLSHYENGLREPGLSFVDAACRYYGVSADYLLGRSGVRCSFAEEEEGSPALRALTEKGAQALLALREGLRGAGEGQLKDMETLLDLGLYRLLRPFDPGEAPGRAGPSLSGAAIDLLQARLLAGEALRLEVPEPVRSGAESSLSQLRARIAEDKEGDEP